MISCVLAPDPVDVPGSGLLFLFLPLYGTGKITGLIKRPLSMLEAGPLINSSASFVFAKSSLAPRPIHATYETICGVVLAVILTRDSRLTGVCCTGRIYIPCRSSFDGVKFLFCLILYYSTFYITLGSISN